MRWKLLALAVCLSLLTGCALPRSREMGETALMRTLGVDGPAGRVTATLSSGWRSKGVQGDQEPPLVLSAQSPSISGAVLAMRGMSDSQVFCGHVGQLLLGEELACDGVWEVLEYVCRSEELGLGTQLWLVQGGEAQDAMEAAKDQGVDRRLSAIQANGELGRLVCTVGETITALLEDGSAYLPALAVEEGRQPSPLTERGYGVLKDGALVLWLTDESARGLELAQGRPGRELLEVGDAVVRVERSRLGCRPVLEDGKVRELKLSLELTVSVEQGIVQDPEVLCAQVEREELRKVLDTVALLQDYGADCLGLGRRAALACPLRSRQILDGWAEDFPELELRGSCHAVLGGSHGEEVEHGRR